MAGSLDSRARRVRRLEERKRTPIRPATSWTQEEAQALDVEIRALEGELQAQGVNPDECLRGASVDLPLDEEIARLEEELKRCPED